MRLKLEDCKFEVEAGFSKARGGLDIEEEKGINYSKTSSPLTRPISQIMQAFNWTTMT